MDIIAATTSLYYHIMFHSIGCSIGTDIIVTKYYSKNICSECVECSDPQIVTISPPTVSRGPTSSPTNDDDDDDDDDDEYIATIICVYW